MSEFTLLFRSVSVFDQPPEQMQAYSQKWVTWFRGLGEKGLIKNAGAPLQPNGKVVKGKDKTIHDGPFAEAKDVVNGYTLIEARDLDHAVEIASGCPLLELGGAVEVRPVRLL
ncbi:MAG: YciI family protein [Pseudomonadota bacterium]